jgi:hypothetical protein
VPVADVRKDPTALTMTVEAAFDAPIARIWQLWEDPRGARYDGRGLPAD